MSYYGTDEELLDEDATSVRVQHTPGDVVARLVLCDPDIPESVVAVLDADETEELRDWLTSVLGRIRQIEEGR